MVDEQKCEVTRVAMHPVLLEDAALLASSDVRRQRRSGPGGQHRNKVETGVIIVHRPTGVRAEATERRSQHENKRVALARLRLNLALQVRTARTADVSASSTWRDRTHSGRILVNPHNEQFPVLLAKALDTIDNADYDVAMAARTLGVTGSQLVRFLKLDPRALSLVNQQREQRGQHSLR